MRIDMKAQNLLKTALFSVLAIGITGCATNTGTDALIGAGAGAAAGAAITRGHPGGVILGSAIGAVTGAVIGNQQDKAQAYRDHYYYGYPPPPPPYPYETRTIVHNPDGTTTVYVSRTYGY
jgi:hypothetical protein